MGISQEYLSIPIWNTILNGYENWEIPNRNLMGNISINSHWLCWEPAEAKKNMGFLTLKFDDSSGVFTNSHHPIRREVRISGIKRDGTGKEDMDVANKIANLGILWGIIGFDGLISENLQSEITCCLGQVSTTANKSSGSS